MINKRSKTSRPSTLLTATDLAHVHGGADSYRLLAQIAHHQAELAAADLEAAATKTTTTSKQ